MSRFSNLGRTLALLRELRGKSQAWVARRSGTGKSQISKYEGGRELPKLETLERIFDALEIDTHGFFYTLALIDGRARSLPSDSLNLEPPLLPGLGREVSGATEEAYAQVFAALLRLYRHSVEMTVAAASQGEERRGE